MATIPPIETQRLILRPHKKDDLVLCAAMWADPDIVRYTTGVVSSEQKTWMRMLSYLGLWEILGFGYWAVEEKSSGKYIGELGFADFCREMNPSLKGYPEMGWAFCREAHGKGYATEGCLAALEWGKTFLSSRKLFCIIHPKNSPSFKIAEKCGFKKVLETTINDVPEVLLECDLPVR